MEAELEPASAPAVSATRSEEEDAAQLAATRVAIDGAAPPTPLFGFAMRRRGGAGDLMRDA